MKITCVIHLGADYNSTTLPPSHLIRWTTDPSYNI